MSSLNYAVFGRRFSLEGTFRLLRMEGEQRELFYDEVVDCGISTSSIELKAMIAKACTLQFVDFGNGLAGLCGQCDDVRFCVVPEHEHHAITELKPVCHTEETDEEDIF